jgi:hypothetical protein
MGHERVVADHLMEVEKVNTSFERAGDPNKKEPDVIYEIGVRTVVNCGVEGNREGEVQPMHV